MQLLRNWFSKWSEKLQRLATLQDGWDSYRAPGPSSDALQRARSVLAALSNGDCEPSRIAPSVVGGIGITCRRGPRKAYLEICNNGSTCVLFSDGQSDPHAEDVQADPPALQTLVVRIREYLDA